MYGYLVVAVSYNPVELMDIGLTSPSDFKITDDNCLDCNGGYNFTYGVQVSHSFPATNAKLRFGEHIHLLCYVLFIQ